MKNPTGKTEGPKNKRSDDTAVSPAVPARSFRWRATCLRHRVSRARSGFSLAIAGDINLLPLATVRIETISLALVFQYTVYDAVTLNPFSIQKCLRDGMTIFVGLILNEYASLQTHISPKMYSLDGACLQFRQSHAKDIIPQTVLKIHVLRIQTVVYAYSTDVVRRGAGTDCNNLRGFCKALHFNIISSRLKEVLTRS